MMRSRNAEHARYSWHSPASAGERLGISARLVREHIEAGTLPAMDVSLPGAQRKEWRISEEAIREFEQSRTTGQKAA